MASESAIVVLGATGNQGAAVVKYLQALKTPSVYAVTRDVNNPRSKQLASVFDAKLLVGDLEQKESLLNAFQAPGKPVVAFCMSTPCMAGHGFVANAEAEIEKGKQMIDAAKEAGVKHVVFSSVAACDKDHAPGYLQSKKAIEDHLKESGLSWTILRPTSFFEIWARFHPPCKGSVAGLVKGNVKQNWVSLEDVGAVGATVLSDPEKYAGQTLVLAADDLSGEDMAQQLGKLRKEKFSYSVAWLMRIFLYFFAGPIYEERVTFHEKGGFGQETTPLHRIAAGYPESFKRDGPIQGAMTFEKFCLRYQLNGPLPARSGFGYNALYFLGIVGAVAAALAYMLPRELWEDMQRRWAFYLFCFCLLLWVFNKAKRVFLK